MRFCQPASSQAKQRDRAGRLRARLIGALALQTVGRRAIAEIDLQRAADDRLDAGLGQLVGELERAEEVVGVGEADRGKALRRRQLGEPGDGDGAFQQRVGRVHLEMHEGRPGCRPGRAAAGALRIVVSMGECTCKSAVLQALGCAGSAPWARQVADKPVHNHLCRPVPGRSAGPWDETPDGHASRRRSPRTARSSWRWAASSSACCSAPWCLPPTSAPWARSATSTTSATGAASAPGCWPAPPRSSAPSCCRRAASSRSTSRCIWRPPASTGRATSWAA